MLGEDGTIRCPCNGYGNKEFKTISEIRCDLMTKGFLINYKDQVFHGKEVPILNYVDNGEYDVLLKIWMTIILQLVIIMTMM